MREADKGSRITMSNGKKLRMNEVRSTCLAAVGYDYRTSELHLQFRRDQEGQPPPEGGVYVYLQVPASVYVTLMQSESMGEYYNRHIKSAYPLKESAWTKARREVIEDVARRRYEKTASAKACRWLELSASTRQVWVETAQEHVDNFDEDAVAYAIKKKGGWI